MRGRSGHLLTSSNVGSPDTVCLTIAGKNIRGSTTFWLEQFSSFIRFRSAYLLFNFLLRDWEGRSLTEQEETWLEREREFLQGRFDW